MKHWLNVNKRYTVTEIWQNTHIDEQSHKSSRCNKRCIVLHSKADLCSSGGPSTLQWKPCTIHSISQLVIYCFILGNNLYTKTKQLWLFWKNALTKNRGKWLFGQKRFPTPVPVFTRLMVKCNPILFKWTLTKDCSAVQLSAHTTD